MIISNLFTLICTGLLNDERIRPAKMFMNTKKDTAKAEHEKSRLLRAFQVIIKPPYY